jgi:hypothetical protein
MPRDRRYPLSPSERQRFFGAAPQFDAVRPDDEEEDDLGQHFGYGPQQGVALPAGTALAPGTLTQLQYQVNNKRHHGFYLKCQSTGPFLVNIKVGSRYLYNTAMHSANVFGTSAGSPGPYLRPQVTDTNDTVIFECQDISGATNYLYIHVDGVER